MKQLVVLNCLPSRIISEGITRILHSIKSPQITVALTDGVNPLNDEIESINPSIVFIDPISIPQKEIDTLKEEFPEIRFVGLTTTILPEKTVKAYDDVISVYDGVGAIENIVAKVSQKKEDSQKELSPREKEIVAGIVRGLSNKEIAAENNISIHTVMTHRKNIATKLQIHSTAGLTIYAIVSELVRIEDINH